MFKSYTTGPRLVGATLFGIAAFTMFGGLSHSFGATTTTSSVIGVVLFVIYFVLGMWCYKDASRYADIFNYQVPRANVSAALRQITSRREIIAGSILGMSRLEAIAAIEKGGYQPAERSPYGACTLEECDDRIIFYVRDGLVFKSEAA